MSAPYIISGLYRILLSVCFTAITCCVAACSDDFYDRDNVVEGVPVTIDLDFESKQIVTTRISTRSQHNRLPDNIYDAFLFIFDGNGNIRTRYYFRNGANVSSQTYSTNGDNTAVIDRTAGTIRGIKTTSGACRIALVVNARTHLDGDNRMFYYLRDVVTFNDLTNVIEHETGVEFSSIVMSGYFIDQTDVDHDEATRIGGYEVTINPDGTIGSGYGKIFLVPTMADISVNVNCHVKDDKSFATFTPSSWQVVNIPLKNYMFYKHKEPEDQQLFTSDRSSIFTDVKVNKSEIGDDSDGKTKSFSFYCQSRYLKGDADKEFNSYNDRIHNAPATASYIILKGRYSGTSKLTIDDNVSEQHVNADVEYRIYLGDFSDDKFNDFKIIRNHHYIYNIEIQGVNDISVKVFTEADRYDVDGDVIATEPHRFINLDSHYEQRVISFDRSEVRDSFNNGTIGYKVRTPYGTFIYNYSDILNFINNDDLSDDYSDWIHFKLFSDNESHDMPADYPGENSGDLWSIRQLLKYFSEHLDDDVIFNNNDAAYFTMYADEYYYETEPGSGTTANWKDFVNQEPRQLMILSRTTSNGIRSSVTIASFGFEQKAIQTVYYTDKSTDSACSVGWGLEFVEEDLTAPGVDCLYFSNAGHYRSGTKHYFSNYSPQDDDNYGRKNLIDFASSKSLSYNDIFDKSTGYLRTNADQMMACMARNRDLNGDGKIDINEIRWYLPSINQYSRITIGMYGIDENSRLLNSEDLQKSSVFKHYLSSSGGGSNDTKHVLWAEEGFSNSSYYNSENWTSNMGKYNIRCVRNLGSHKSGAEKYGKEDYAYDSMFEVYSDGTYNVIEFKYLNLYSTRNTAESTEITGVCKPFSYNNRAARKFAVYNSDLNVSTNYSFNYYNNVVNSGSSDCASINTDFDYGWRLPTVTELCIINMAGLISSGRNYLSRTQYQYKEQSLGLYNENGNYKIGGFSNGSETVYIRCVKDVY